jgi:hypothetical protein
MNRIKYPLIMLLAFCVLREVEVFAQSFSQRGERNFAEEEGFRENRPRRGAGFLGERFEQRREQRRQRIERARQMARRLLEDPNTPADVKAKARRLDSLLTEREALENELVAKRQDFLRDHRQDLDELRQLRERAEVLRQNLRSAREKARAENLPKIQEMRRLTDEARRTAQELRQQYRRGEQEESR